MKNMLNIMMLSLLCLNLLACDNQTKNSVTTLNNAQKIQNSTATPLTQEALEKTRISVSNDSTTITPKQKKSLPFNDKEFEKVIEKKQHLACNQDNDCQVVKGICVPAEVVNKQYQADYLSHLTIIADKVECPAPSQSTQDFQAKCIAQQCQLMHK